MYLFLLLAIPCFLCWYCLSLKEFRFANFMPQAMIGIFVSILLCMVLEFFIFTGFVFTASFGQVFVYNFLNESLVPCFVLYGFFILISIGRDDWCYKSNCFAPLMLGFYLVYIPYKVLTGDMKHSPYMIFVKPVLYICQIWLMQQSIDFGYRMIARRKDLKGIILLVLPLALSVLSPLIETMWYTQISWWAIAPLMLILVAGPIVEYILVQRKANDFVLFRDSASN